MNRIPATYAKKNLVLIIKTKNIKRLEIIAITLIIKGLAKEFEGQFECLGENRKNITFSVPIEKELDNDKTIK